ncbi:ribonuclease D [Alkalimarinus alittae]|uniref:Ribonuclease D n=1 Tax=Alkalimarinus alittae TaxID=2961619 RepID=A0ABY6N703_9ALTE|nr:ribonuclease D [Alkalimarinus alittae]UZE97794.1 ribonuclease D [Alkalimarinus alittae]
MSNFGCSFKVEIIRDTSRLQEKLLYWQRLPFIAIDTEFVRVDTFYPLAGLIQVADDTGIYLIDPLDIDELTILKPLLIGDTIKVMHSMSEDIVLFQTIADCMPQNIFDTQIACALLGQGISLSYQKFIELYLGLEIDKGETRSDWLKRPLSDSQLEYAAKDAHYLYQAYPQLVAQLEERNLTGIVQQECHLINLGMTDTEEDMDNYYLKIRGAWKFPVAHQAILKKLSSWREREARKRNKPRGRIISDKQFLELLECMPKNVSTLQATRVFNSGQLRRYGEYVISVINNPPQVSADFKPIPRSLSGQKLDLYRSLKKSVEVIAESLNIAPELLGKKRLLEQYVALIFAKNVKQEEVALPEVFGEWRIKLLSNAFKKIVKSKFND